MHTQNISSTTLSGDRSIRSSSSVSSLTLGGATLSGDNPSESTISGQVSYGDPSFMVEFDYGDPENPLNWSLTKRWMMTLVAGFIILNW